MKRTLDAKGKRRPATAAEGAASAGADAARVRDRAPTDTVRAGEPEKLLQIATACSSCKLRALCTPCCGLSRAEMEVADRLAFHRARVRRGDSLYRSGDRFVSLYAVRSGFFKSLAVLENGREQVTGFAMPGEVLGMDGIGLERHGCDAVALEESEVCVIPFAGLQQLAHEIPGLQRHFRRTLSREIVHEHGMMLQLGSMTADERLAMFLLDLSRRYAAQGRSPAEFTLRMTREEAGSYLGMTLETVSRTLSKLQHEGLITVQQKFIRILDGAGLQRVMGRGQH